jgi:hypothetical protein
MRFGVLRRLCRLRKKIFLSCLSRSRRAPILANRTWSRTMKDLGSFSVSAVPVERRRHPRTMVQMTLRGVRMDPEEGEIIDSLQMMDISRGGMGALVDRAAYPGQRFILCLPLSDKGGRRNVYATVMRSRQTEGGCHVGLRFDNFANDAWVGVSTAVAEAA